MTQTIRGALLALILLASPAWAQDDVGKKTTPDGRFTIDVELPRLPVLSQGNTGTCWSFATVSFVETELERITQKRVDLSEIYPVYHTYLEKAKRYVASKGKSRFSQGGLSHDIVDVVGKYGLVPQSNFDGLCEGQKTHNHSELERVLKAMLDGLVGDEKSRRRSRRAPADERWVNAVKGVLDAYLGERPETVAVDGRELTPQAYAKEVLRFPLEDFVEVMSFSYAPFYDRAKLTVPDNWMDYDRYVNVPVTAMMTAIDHALDHGYSIAIDIDVSEPGFQARRGVASLPKDLEKDGAITQELREEMFKSGKTTDDHLMHIVGRATDADGKVWYMTKNSWGAVGPYKGDLYMSRNYVALKTLAVMIDKNGLPEGLRQKANLN